MKKKGGNLGEKLYDGAAGVGILMATITLFIGILISIILIGAGIYLLLKKKTSTNIKGIIKTAKCKNVTEEINNKSTTIVNCDMTVEYTVDGKIYTAPLVTNNRTRNVGDSISIKYKNDNPNIISNNINSSNFAYGLIVIAIVIVLFVSVNYYKVNHNKFYAAASGVRNIID